MKFKRVLKENVDDNIIIKLYKQSPNMSKELFLDEYNDNKKRKDLKGMWFRALGESIIYFYQEEYGGDWVEFIMSDGIESVVNDFVRITGLNVTDDFKKAAFDWIYNKARISQ